MAATFEWKVTHGAAPGTDWPADGTATNANLMSTDVADEDDTTYQGNPVTVPTTGTAFSYERYLKGRFSGSFNSIAYGTVWHDAGSLSDAGLDLVAGIKALAGYVTPVNTDSTISTTILTDWDSAAEGLTIIDGTITDSPGTSDYLVMQLDVPYDVTTPGDIGSQTIKMSYYET